MLFACFFGGGFFSIIFYMAIYFQSVKGSTATHAGIQLLPLLISCVMTSMITGGLISTFGYYTPIMIVSMALFAVGSGLITTFNINTTLGQWFGYQVLCGAGIGVGFQGGIIAVQTVLPLVDVPVATACVSFFQSLGGAIMIAICQSLFQTGLVSGIEKNAPQLDAHLFLQSGATQIRSLLQSLGQEDALDAILEAYVKGLTDTFRVTLACACVAFAIACGLDWKSVKKGHGQGAEKVADLESSDKSVDQTKAKALEVEEFNEEKAVGKEEVAK
jgi:MFS family permease